MNRLVRTQSFWPQAALRARPLMTPSRRIADPLIIRTRPANPLPQPGRRFSLIPSGGKTSAIPYRFVDNYALKVAVNLGNVISDKNSSEEDLNAAYKKILELWSKAPNRKLQKQRAQHFVQSLSNSCKDGSAADRFSLLHFSQPDFDKNKQFFCDCVEVMPDS